MDNMSRYTPGPWVVTTCDEGEKDGWVEIQQDGEVHPCPDDICRVHRRGTAGSAFDDGSHMADAALIAAAPELLDYIGTIQAEAMHGERSGVEALDACTRIIALTRAAIARAEGRA